MIIRAQHKYVKSSPKKLRFIAKNIRELSPLVAMARLLITRNRSARMLYGAVKSAVDNGLSAHKIESGKLKFDEIRIDEGSVLRRIRPGARGMAKPYRRKTSHITVTLKVVENKVVEKKDIAPVSDKKPSIIGKTDTVVKKDIKVKKVTSKKAK